MKTAIYCRVSTNEQSPQMQTTALQEYCTARGLEVFNVYIDQGVSGTKDTRPELNRLMNDARKRLFDVVLVYRFDRFARSTKHLITALEEFKSLGIEFISYSENIDTSSALGKAMFVIVGAMAELERNIIVERVKAGLHNARLKGKRLGRPSVSYDPAVILGLSKEGFSTRDIARKTRVSNATVSRVLHNLQKSLPVTI